MRAVGTLQKDPKYADRITTEIIPMRTEKGKFSKMLYEWGGDGHGLVVLAPDDEVLAVIKGHNWGKGKDEVGLEVLKKTIDPLLAR